MCVCVYVGVSVVTMAVHVRIAASPSTPTPDVDLNMALLQSGEPSSAEWVGGAPRIFFSLDNRFEVAPALLLGGEYNPPSGAQVAAVDLSELSQDARTTRTPVSLGSVATGKKLDLASKADAFTFRSLASLISLVCYAVHTTRLNPSWLFLPMRMDRAIFHTISRTSRWDDRVTLISPAVKEALDAST
eukprot:gene9829-6902_t